MILFSFDYPPNNGGIARLCGAIVRGLASRGYSIRVISEQFDERTEPDLDRFVETIRVNQKRPIREIEVIRKLQNYQEATCISGIWYPDGLIAQLGGFEYHVILAHSAELYPPTQRWRRPLWDYLQRATLERANIVIANSHFTADFVRQVAPKAKVIAVPLAVDHEQFYPRDRTIARSKWDITQDKIIICTVSRIHRFKGHETVLAALACLPAQIQDRIVYLVGGRGPDLNYLQTEAKNLRIDHLVRWLGYIADEDLATLYSASDLFVLATRDNPNQRSVEGFGLAFLEAQACGIPVVGTNTGGIPDAITHEDGGWLIEQDNIGELANIFIELYNNPTKFQHMGEKARQRVEREFTWEHYLDRLINALELGVMRLDEE